MLFAAISSSTTTSNGTGTGVARRRVIF